MSVIATSSRTAFPAYRFTVCLSGYSVVAFYANLKYWDMENTNEASLYEEIYSYEKT
jgi:hypothetical protein